MLKYFLLLSLTFSQVVLAKNNSIHGEGRFITKEGDSLSFIKKQLIYEALLDVVSKELTSLGLNKEIFWQKYNDRLDSSLSTADQSLKIRFKIGSNKETPQLLTQYTEEMRKKRLKMRLRYAGLDRVMSSYSIKRVSRSPQNPNVRFIKLDANVDRRLLSKIYYSFVRGKKNSDFGSLYLNVEYDLKNCSFTDLGVENKNDLTETVNRHWLEWLSNNKPQNIANIEILSDDKKNSLKSYQALPLEKLYESVPDIFENSLLLNVNIQIDRLAHNQKFKEYEFEYSGNLYLQDLQTGKIILQGKITNEVQKYSEVKETDLSSIIANYIYRMPLAKFANIKNTMANIPPLSMTKTLTLFNYQNLNDVDKFMQLLSERGVKYSLSSKLISLSANKAQLMVYFDGEFNQLKDLLNTVESAKKDLPFEVIDSKDGLGIKFNKVSVL